jgi:tetratricopeptide (TPR) repeat protein
MMDEGRAGESMALLHAAMRAEASGDLAQASARGEDAMRGFDAAGDPTGAAVARQFLGNIRIELGDPVAAVGLLHQAYALRAHTGDLQGQVSVLQDLLAIALRVGDLDGARQVAERCLAIQQRAANREGQVESRLQVAEVALQLGDVDGADEHVREALAVLDRPADGALRAHVVSVQARVALARGDLDAADRFGAQAVALAEALNHRPSAADGLEVMAQVLISKAKYAEALPMLEKVLEVRLLMRDPFATAGTLHKLGTADAALSRWDDAVDHLLHAASAYGEADEPEAAAGACQSLARLLDDAGMLERALEVGERALEYAGEASEPAAAVWHDQAFRLVKIGDIDGAATLLRDGIGHAAVFPEARASLEASLGEVMLAAGLPEGAVLAARAKHDA